MDARTLRRLRKREPLIRERLAACPGIADWPDVADATKEFLRNDPELRRLLKHLPPVAFDLVHSEFLSDLRTIIRRMVGDVPKREYLFLASHRRQFDAYVRKYFANARCRYLSNEVQLVGWAGGMGMQLVKLPGWRDGMSAAFVHRVHHLEQRLAQGPDGTWPIEVTATSHPL